MNVYLLRHGIAEDYSVSARDEDRELTQEGIEKLKLASAGWKRVIGHIDRVFSSPLIRARQTAEILHQAAGVEEPIAEAPQLVP